MPAKEVTPAITVTPVTVRSQDHSVHKQKHGRQQKQELEQYLYNICSMDSSNRMVAGNSGGACNSKEAASKLKPTTTRGICQKQQRREL
jgi:hypothetical protein